MEKIHLPATQRKLTVIQPSQLSGANKNGQMATVLYCREATHFCEDSRTVGKTPNLLQRNTLYLYLLLDAECIASCINALSPLSRRLSTAWTPTTHLHSQNHSCAPNLDPCLHTNTSAPH